MVSSSLPHRARHSRPAPLRTALLVLALALTAACGQSKDPGVTVTNTQSDVVFGNASPTPTPTVVVQPPFSPRAPQGPAPFPNVPPPPGFGDPGPLPTDDSGPPAKPSICPGPPLFATAPTPATIVVEDKPRQGFYLWQSITSKDAGNNVTIKTAKYTNYEVRNVSETTTRTNPQGADTTVFTFDVVMPVGKGDVMTFTYQVKQNAVGQDVKTGNVGQPTRVSEPDAGLSIKAEVLRNAAGEVVYSFTPVTPVLILPLPVAAGASFTGSGADPTTGDSLTVRGTIVGPSRVTACRSFVQGYRVEAAVTSGQGPSSSSSDQAFTIETQDGGLVVGAEVTPTGSDTTQLSIVGDPVPAPQPQRIPKEDAL